MDDFSRFFDNSLDINGIANADGHFRRVNSAWERTLGWTADEVSASPWLDFVHPDDRESTIEAGERLFGGMSIISFENRYRCKDGSYRLIQWHAQAVGREAYCSGRDVTAERSRLVLRANTNKLDELRGHDPWFFAIFDNAPFAMALTTIPEGVAVAVNEAFLKLFDFTRDEVLGRTSINLGIAGAEANALLAAELGARGAVRDFECERRTKGGARVVLLLNVDRIDVEGDAYVLTSVRDITRASTAAAELRGIVDNLPELAWTARPDGFIEFYNRRWYDYTGTHYEDMQGWGWQSVHDPNELPRVIESWTQSIATRQPFDQVFPLQRKDGVFRWFLTRVAPIFDDTGVLIRWVGINTDVDDQRRDQEALQEMAAVVESADDAVITTGLDGTIRSWNPGATRLLGYRAEEIVGALMTPLIPDDRHDEESQILERIKAGKHVLHFETVRKRKDGSLVDVSLTVSPIHGRGGAIVAASKIMRDVTERNQAEQERSRLVEQLQALNAELEQRVRVRTAELSVTLKEREVLLQEVHHRVKNNLQVISSLMNMQRRKLEDRASRDALEECQTRVQAIALIHEKLYQSNDYSRVPFSEYARSLAGNVFHATGVSPANISLEIAIEDIALAVDKAIPCGLVLNELITNALKHGFPDGRRGTIRVELGKLDGGRLRLAVKDDGIGIATGADIRKSESLGMQLVYTLTEQLEGTVEIRSEGGTVFELIFPGE